MAGHGSYMTPPPDDLDTVTIYRAADYTDQRHWKTVEQSRSSRL